MRWTVLNGSPRGKKSNTRVMLEQVRAGMAEASEAANAGTEAPARNESAGSALEWSEYLLRDIDGHSRAAEAVLYCDGLLLAYPLYTDSMPGITVRFLETLAAVHGLRDRFEGRKVPAAFIVHSGFPDGIHTAHLPDIHREICTRFGFTYAGTLRKPGSEPVRLMPAKMQKRTFRTLEEAGAALIGEGCIPPDLEDALVRYETPGPGARLGMRILSATGLINMYWISMLKKHGAWKRRFDAPYGG